MAEEKKSNRQLMGERYKSKNPDFNIDDDEAMFGEALSELAAGDEAQAQRKRLNETIANNDIAPELLNGIISGKTADGGDFDLRDYLLNEHIDYLLDYVEDSDKAKEKWNARKEERKTQAEAEAKLKAEAEAKLKAEDEELDAAIAESGYKPEQVKDLIDWIYDGEKGFIKRAQNFDLKKEDFLRLFKIKDWDIKMSEAEDKGYKRGRNERIDMFRRNQERRKSMPADIEGGGGASPVEKEDPYIERLKKMKNM